MKSFSIFMLTPFLAAVFLLHPISLQAKENSISDTAITKEVRQKIRDNLFYSVYDWVTVSTRNGAVTLRGYVHLPWIKLFSKKLQKELKVLNRLRIK